MMEKDTYRTGADTDECFTADKSTDDRKKRTRKDEIPACGCDEAVHGKASG